MKKIIALFSFVFVLFVSTNALAFTGISPDEESGDVTIESNEVISDNLATAGNNVYIRGNIDDDLFVAGNSIKIDGDVNGTLFVAGNTVIISGHIAKDAIVMANMLTLEDTGSVERDLMAAGNIVTLNGSVGRNLSIACSKLTINNIVNGNAKVNASDIALGDNSQVKGDLSYTAEKEIDIKNSQFVSGKIDFNQIENIKTTPSTTSLISNWIVGLLQLMVVGFLVALLAPKWLEKLSDIQKQQMPKSIGIGFLVTMVAPVMILFLLVTIAGIPLAIMATALYFVLIYLTKIFVGFYIGKLIRPKLNPVLTVLLGLLIIQIIFTIPFISFLAKLFIIILGLGAMYISLTNKPVNK